MPDSNEWSVKREEQYEKVEESEKEMGKSDDEAEASATQTVTKESARKGDVEEVVKND